MSVVISAIQLANSFTELDMYSIYVYTLPLVAEQFYGGLQLSASKW